MGLEATPVLELRARYPPRLHPAEHGRLALEPTGEKGWARELPPSSRRWTVRIDGAPFLRAPPRPGYRFDLLPCLALFCAMKFKRSIEVSCGMLCMLKLLQSTTFPDNSLCHSLWFLLAQTSPVTPAPRPPRKDTTLTPGDKQQSSWHPSATVLRVLAVLARFSRVCSWHMRKSQLSRHVSSLPFCITAESLQCCWPRWLQSVWWVRQHRELLSPSYCPS